jgi:hypothetical protein
VEELEETLAWDELEDWRAYDLLDPVGNARLERMLAVVAAAAASAWGGKVKPDRFLPDHEGAVRRWLEEQEAGRRRGPRIDVAAWKAWALKHGREG